MGIAAYNRGTRAISNQIDAKQRPVEFEIMDRLNGYPKGERKLLYPTVIRVTAGGQWWLMNRPDRGWAENGIVYASARELFADWSITITGVSRDQHFVVYEVTS